MSPVAFAVTARRGQGVEDLARGDINKDEPLEEQYGRLRRSGYPIVIRHVVDALGEQALDLLGPRTSDPDLSSNIDSGIANFFGQQKVLNTQIPGRLLTAGRG